MNIDTHENIQKVVNDVKNFSVDFKDKQAPAKTYCPTEPITIASIGIPLVFTWEEPRFTDIIGVSQVTRIYTDSVGNTEVISNLPILRYYYESITVTYRAVDDAGNVAECSFDVIPTNCEFCLREI